MNERIQELAKQAKGFVDLNQHVGGEKGCMVYTYDGLEKFAELLVQECIGLCMNVNGDLPRTEPLVAASIKKHFGVE